MGNNTELNNTFLFLIICFIFTLLPEAHAFQLKTSIITEFKILPSDGAAEDYFGQSVSISGDYAIVGAYGDDDHDSDSGSAYIFERSGRTWTQAAKLNASDGAADDLFGKSVSISGDYAVVNAFWDDDKGSNSGSVYIFERSSGIWTQMTKLTAGDGAVDDWFGFEVSLSGDYAIFGAPMEDTNGSDSGSAYIFERSGGIWTQAAKLTAGDGAADDRFGYDVSISGDYAIVGAYGDDDNGSSSGSAYIFERSGGIWTQAAKLTAGDGAADDFFGRLVSISGEYAVVGAYGDDDHGSSSGSAYIFEKSGGIWIQAVKLTAGDGAADDFFGWDVSISDNYAIVATPYNDATGSSSGAAYIFERNDGIWTQAVKLVASDSTNYHYFGQSVSIWNNRTIVSAFNDDNGWNSGSAYIYSFSGIAIPGIPLLLLSE